MAGGELEVYELHVSGAQANVTIFARKAPHYLIKQELTQPPPGSGCQGW